MTYIFFDCETTGPSPVQHEMIAIAMIATDKDYNELGRLEEFCRPEGDRITTNVFGREYNQWPDATGSSNPATRNATDVHGIDWNTAKDFQEPIGLYRAMWGFIASLPKGPIKLIFHSSSFFDTRMLFYRCNLHAPPLYKELMNRCHFWEYEDECDKSVGGVYRLRYDDTMGMARRYIKEGKNYLTQLTKTQKRIDKLQDMLTKTRKTPLSPSKTKAYNDEKEELYAKLGELTASEVVLEGYSLDKITRSLGIKHIHHSAISDSEVLIPIHKFLSNNLS